MAHFIDSFTKWGPPPPQGNLRDGQLIIAHEYAGLRTPGKRAKTAVDVARLAATIHRHYHLPVYPQGEVGDVLEEMGIPLAGKVKGMSGKNPLTKGYIDSYLTAKDHFEYCQKMGYTRVVLVGFAPHIWRAKWITEKLGLTVIIPRGIPNVVFDSDVSQRRWASPWSAYPYELGARVVHDWPRGRF